MSYMGRYFLALASGALLMSIPTWSKDMVDSKANRTIWADHDKSWVKCLTHHIVDDSLPPFSFTY